MRTGSLVGIKHRTANVKYLESMDNPNPAMPNCPRQHARSWYLHLALYPHAFFSSGYYILNYLTHVYPGGINPLSPVQASVSPDKSQNDLFEERN